MTPAAIRDLLSRPCSMRQAQTGNIREHEMPSAVNIRARSSGQHPRSTSRARKEAESICKSAPRITSAMQMHTSVTP
eukprot:CAMPEP_0180804712 /NCGR_PEP_ID=MMETSP1038_2-20121128/61611_1 /TAXON_ID=632150 /ORGANISM="Azadinium spinosum, Strain 3D9" /LENGTH=76 /DNA_ID=CAMNT_0022845181 /DNA_START=1061 /DNA_END=1287 /DNA_ORIENTATION=-